MRKDEILSGNPKLVGVAAGAAGVVTTTVLLPFNTLQTIMQTSGERFLSTTRTISQHGTLFGIRRLYKALPPTMMMVGMRHGFTFGTGAELKKYIPSSWSEPMRDAMSMAVSALLCTSFLFPMDTVKTRMQADKPFPKLRQLYQGFTPAVVHSVVGRAVWITTRNDLEARVPTPEDKRLASWKHFVCGGITGIGVTLCVFPLDTLKKWMQAFDLDTKPRGTALVLSVKGRAACRAKAAHRRVGRRERAASLQLPRRPIRTFTATILPCEEKRVTKIVPFVVKRLQNGGIQSLYRGVSLKLSMNFMQGACFNLAFVVCKDLFERTGSFESSK